VGFEALLAACGGDMRRFVAAVKRIGPESFPGPDTQAIDGILRARAARGCDAP
jgi:hypothetical protein